MKPSKFLWACSVSVLFFAGTPDNSLLAKDKAANEIAAIEFLGTVDCYWYPESQSVLIQSLTKDPREEVRHAAALALTQQLQHAKMPLDALSGWRKFPDPLILTQIARLSTGRGALTPAELHERYAQRKFDNQQKADARRGDCDRGCCNEEVMAALSKTAYDLDETGCYVEPSARVRLAAERALRLCCDPGQTDGLMPTAPPPGSIPLAEASPNETVPPGTTPSPETPTLPPQQIQPAPAATPTQSSYASGAYVPSYSPGAGLSIAGRADTTNRFNVFDNVGIAPRTRVWFGYQFVDRQNNAVALTGDSEELFSILGTSTGRSQFISFTGFGSGQGVGGSGGDVAIDPNEVGSGDELIDAYLEQNAGRSQAFLQLGNTSLYRFGFEYALTTDFSFAMQAQYVMPLDDVEQPEMFSNPQIQLKHVLYRDPSTIFSGILAVSPQIPKPEFAIAEDTSRVNPGLMYFHELDDKWFLQSAAGFSFGTDPGQIKTFDYILGMGVWMYRHESLLAGYTGPKPEKWLLGIVPQIEVLGKHILGTTTVRGLFDLSTSSPQTAEGTFSPVDGTRTIYLPQDPSRAVTDVPIFFNEPRHVVDLTAAVTIVMRGNVQWTSGISIPVTGGNARALEFLTTVNYGF